MDGSDKVKNGKEIELLLNQIEQEYDAKEKKPLPFVDQLANPASYSMTVENIFHSAFLIKEGRLSLKVATFCGKKIPVMEPITADCVSDAPKKQSILSFSADDWRKWSARMRSSDHLCPL